MQQAMSTVRCAWCMTCRMWFFPKWKVFNVESKQVAPCSVVVSGTDTCFASLGDVLLNCEA